MKSVLHERFLSIFAINLFSLKMSKKELNKSAL